MPFENRKVNFEKSLANQHVMRVNKLVVKCIACALLTSRILKTLIIFETDWDTNHTVCELCVLFTFYSLFVYTSRRIVVCRVITVGVLHCGIIYLFGRFPSLWFESRRNHFGTVRQLFTVHDNGWLERPTNLQSFFITC